MKLNPLDLAALNQEVGNQLPRVARDVEGEARISPCISGWERMAPRWQILRMRGQVGDPVLIVRKAQGIVTPSVGWRLSRARIRQCVTIGPLHRVPRHAQKALIGMKRIAAHPLPERWKIG